MERRDGRQTYEGYGDGVARGFELVVACVLLGGVGYLIDGWAGTVPLFTTLMAVIGIVGASVTLWYEYENRMRAQEAAAVWAPRPAIATDPVVDPVPPSIGPPAPGGAATP